MNLWLPSTIAKLTESLQGGTHSLRNGYTHSSLLQEETYILLGWNRGQKIKSVCKPNQELMLHAIKGVLGEQLIKTSHYDVPGCAGRHGEEPV